MINFSGRLKELRIAKGDTQIGMAKLLGCTEQHYQRFEYGKVTPNAIVISKLADYFDVSTDYLLGRTDNPQRY
ncbi:MAG: helix-turn-helix domain-containing protein [Defluviitaleaceae bacterium]|nr:helix-turn-helix domain-containing protein [Defluviitaleaceae bacterium]